LGDVPYHPSPITLPGRSLMAATNVLMPQMGYDMTEGKILKWIKHEGDQVNKGEVIAEIETDKVNIEIEAFASGTLLKIVVPEGKSIPVGQPIAIIGQPGEEMEIATPPSQELPKQEEGTEESAEAPPTSVAVRGPRSEAKGLTEEERAHPGAMEPQPAAARGAAEEEEERVKASPVARRFAHEQGVPLNDVQGTGPGGRITKEDVERFLTEAASRSRAPEKSVSSRPAGAERSEGQSSAPPEETQPAAAGSPAPTARPGKATTQPQAAPMPPLEGIPAETREVSRMGQAIARRMALSKQTVPHFYATIEVDMSPAANLREELNRTLSDEAKISFNDFVMKAAAMALTRYPVLNSTFHENQLTIYKQVNVAMAVALEQGLITPVVRECDKKPLAQISRESKELMAHVRDGKLRQEEYEGGTFTVSNMGMFGVEDFAAIINPPQAAILAVGAIMPRAVVRAGQLAVATTMKATISVDHRAANGADGARYLQQLKEILEDPIRLLL
jgi:pyruvate dehydrogenase E2 component (dihydrolipoamide acetyltransferase)